VSTAQLNQSACYFFHQQPLAFISGFKINRPGLTLPPPVALLISSCQKTITDMLIVHVHVHVKAECIDAFKAATLANASASLQEPGIARFDVGQQTDDPTRFVLVEVYRTLEAPAAHKETTHYATWRDAVASMMASPRTSVKFTSAFPPEAGW
jgi:(4S)-4-hydroxy-5-phosphonooxypentane-2,3-dione isomerase